MFHLVQFIQVIILAEGTVWNSCIASCITAAFVVASRVLFNVANEIPGDFPTLHPTEPTQQKVQNDH